MTVTASRLRELTCLTHAVPGVTVRLWTADGRDVLVSAACLGADLDPCRLRAAVLAGRHVGIERIELVSGIAPLGGGLFQRDHPGAASQRWFVSTLDAHRIATTAAACPAADGCRTVIKPDPELGQCAVCVAADAAVPTAVLDEAALRVLAAVLVEELLDDCAPPHRSDIRGESRPSRRPAN